MKKPEPCCFRSYYYTDGESEKQARTKVMHQHLRWPQCPLHKRDLEIIGSRGTQEVRLSCPVWMNS